MANSANRSGKRKTSTMEDPLTLLRQASVKLHSFWVRLSYPFASKVDDLSIHYTCRLPRSAAPRIRIGRSVVIGKDAWINVSVPPGMSGEPVIVIEANCRILSRCQISAKNSIHLERGVVLSSSVLLHDHNHAYDDVELPINEQGINEGGRITIGEGCLIGYGAAIICPSGELRLGRNCIVGANSVVTRSFPPYSIIEGNPARLVKQLDPVNHTWVKVLRDSATVAPFN